MLLIIDNYDSFTYNLFHYLGEIGCESEIIRNDKASCAEILNSGYSSIIISPGPCTPNEAGVCLELIATNKGEIPILGVCLGHQAIAQAYGGTVVRAESVMHGKTSQIVHRQNEPLFANVPSPFTATRYHSLIVANDSLPDQLLVTATTGDRENSSYDHHQGGNKVIMAIRHVRDPVFGVQFHPESIASQHGHTILRNFINIADNHNKARKLVMN